MFLCDLTSRNNILMFWFLLWITKIMTKPHFAWNEQHWDTASPKLAEQLEKAIRAGSSFSGGVRQLHTNSCWFSGQFLHDCLSSGSYQRATANPWVPRLTRDLTQHCQACFVYTQHWGTLPGQLWPGASAATTVWKIIPFLSVMSRQNFCLQFTQTPLLGSRDY